MHILNRPQKGEKLLLIVVRNAPDIPQKSFMR
jgi:hypothetical protein